MEEGANSTLSIAKVGPMDSGNYTCQLTTMPDQPATIHVHVLNGECHVSCVFFCSSYLAQKYHLALEAIRIFTTFTVIYRLDG